MNAPVNLGIVDYGMGNRRSVQKAFEHVGARATISRDADVLRAADGLVVPGVGAFPKAMENLERFGLAELIIEQAGARRPLLGICLGMQLLFESSEEMGGSEGLKLIPGRVTGLRSGGLRVPHIGWNEVRFEHPSALTPDLPLGGCPFYHVHSYAARPERDEDVLGTCQYGERFATIVGHDSTYGVQFHPEKSSAHGLRLLANFAALCRRQATVGGRAAA